ncbi:MAG: hypothetical protein WBF31_22045 [Anaerolineae bacterium]
MNTSANGASLPVAVSEIQRNQQAQIVNDFVDAILALDPSANIVALGDFNDFQFSTPLAILKGGVLTDLITGLPAAEQYSYVYDGNAQVLDHILISNHLRKTPAFHKTQSPISDLRSLPKTMTLPLSGFHAMIGAIPSTPGALLRNLNRDRIESSRKDTRAL